MPQGPRRFVAVARVVVGARWQLASFLTLAAGVLWQLRYVGMPIGADLHDFRQSQTAMVVREFMRHGFNWRTPLPVFGHGSYVPFEFPLFQWIAAIVGKAAGLSADSATRLTGLLFFQMTAVVVWWLAWRWFSRAAALAALALFEFTAYGTQWGHAALVEFMPILLMLLAVVVVDLLLSRPSRRRAVVSSALVLLLVSLAFLVKITTGVALSIVLLIPVADAWSRLQGRARLMALAVPAGAVSLALVVGVLWTRATDHVKEANPRTSWLTSSALHGWTFGTTKQRLSLGTWTHVFDGYWAAVIGDVTLLIVMVLVVTIGWRWRPAAVVLCAAPFVGPLVFTNLYLVHNYYSAAVYPVLVLLAGAAVGVIARWLPTPRDRVWGCAGAVGALLLVAWTSPDGVAYRANLSGAHGPPGLSKELRDIVPAGSGVVLMGCDWNPVIAYYADRPALMLGGGGVPVRKPTARDLAGYSHLAFCVESAKGYRADLAEVLPRGFSSSEVAPGVFSITARP